MLKKLTQLLKVLREEGPGALVRQVANYKQYHLRDKWQFVYFEADVDSQPYALPNLRESLNIRLATQDDIPKIESDVYPFLTAKEEHDKQYIARLGEDGIVLFLGEKDNKIVHYFLVFEHALSSPLMKTPLDRTHIRRGDAYLGSAFTVPAARGLWIVPHAMLSVFDYLRTKNTVTRALVLVHKNTPGASAFYRRLGFRVIENASPSGFLDSWLRRLR